MLSAFVIVRHNSHSRLQSPANLIGWACIKQTLKEVQGVVVLPQSATDVFSPQSSCFCALDRSWPVAAAPLPACDVPAVPPPLAEAPPLDSLPTVPPADELPCVPALPVPAVPPPDVEAPPCEALPCDPPALLPVEPPPPPWPLPVLWANETVGRASKAATAVMVKNLRMKILHGPTGPLSVWRTCLALKQTLHRLTRS